MAGRFEVAAHRYAVGALGRQLFRGLGAKGSAVVVALFQTVLIGRLFGAENSAPLFWLISLTVILSTFASLGMDSLLVQQLPRLDVSSSEASALLTRAHTASLVTALALSLLVGAVMIALASFPLPAWGLLALLAATCSISSLLVVGAALRARGLYFRATILHGVALPLAVCLTAVFVRYLTDYDERHWLPAAYAVSAMLLAAVAVRVSSRVQGGPRRPEFRDRPSPSLVQRGLPFMTTPVLNATLQYLPVVVLGFAGGGAELSVYFAALRVALGLSFVLAAINLVLGPRMSLAYEKNDREGLEHLYLVSVAAGLLTSLPLLLGVALWGERIMDILGGSFRSGSQALTLLVVGSVVNACTGSVLLLLNMTNNERTLGRLNVTVWLLYLVGVAALHGQGAVGLAIGYSAAVATLNVWAVIEGWRLLGITPLRVVQLLPSRRWDR